MPKKQRDPGIIDRAPIEPDQPDSAKDGELLDYIELAGQLAAENADLRSELSRLKGKKTYDDVRSEMMEPYALKVYYFLVAYCLFVAIILLLDGFRVCSFDISDVVLGVIAGSTAVAAIGLVGFVVSGLFGAKKEN